MVENFFPPVLLTLEADVLFPARLFVPWSLYPSTTVALLGHNGLRKEYSQQQPSFSYQRQFHVSARVTLPAHEQLGGEPQPTARGGGTRRRSD